MKVTKLVLSIVSVCFSIAIMVFGVLSATQVTYTVTGRVSYQVTEAYCVITTRILKYGDYGATTVDFPTEGSADSDLPTICSRIGTTNEAIDTLLHSDNGYRTFETPETARNYNTLNKSGNNIRNEGESSGTLSLTSDLTSLRLSLNTTDAKAVIIIVNIDNLGDNQLEVSMGNIVYGGDANANKTAANYNLYCYRNCDNSNNKKTVEATGKINVVVAFSIIDVKSGISNIPFSIPLTISHKASA